MIFEKLLVPRLICGTFREVTPELLRSLGVRFLLCDIDNTLVTYDDPLPTGDVLQWCAALQQTGVRLAFVSNNDAERVRTFNSVLGFPSCAKARKPLLRKLRGVMAEMGASPAETALLGDQLLTDAAAANRAGLYSIIVPPIRDKRTAFFRFKRWLEVPYMKRYRQRHGGRP